jgi:lysophospholipase L1-like esterase
MTEKPRFFRRVLGLLSRAWLITGLTVVLLLFAEAACRIIAPRPPEPDMLIFESQPGEPAAATIQREYFEDFVGAMQGLRWDPYVYWGLSPFTSRWVNIDADGYRKSWTPPRAESTKPSEIWMLGGSTLWGVGARDDWTIPSLVARHLHERGIHATVRNLAVVGYVSTQELLVLGNELRQGGTPDLVVFYDGANDVLSALFNRRAGLPILEPLQADPMRSFIRRSGMYRVLRHSLWRLTGVAPLEPALSDSEIEKLAAEVASVYRENVALAEALGKGRGFESLFLLQPLVFYKQQQTPFEELSEKRDSFVPIGGFDCYTPGSCLEELYRDAYDQIAEHMQSEPAFVDIRSVGWENEEQAFIDFCHTMETANAIIADRIASEVQKRLDDR